MSPIKSNLISFQGLSKASTPSSLGRQGPHGCHYGHASDEAARAFAAERRPAVGRAVVPDLVDESDCPAWLVPRQARHTASSTDLARQVAREKVARSVLAEGNEVAAELLETPGCFCIDPQTRRVEAGAGDVWEGEGKCRSVVAANAEVVAEVVESCFGVDVGYFLRTHPAIFQAEVLPAHAKGHRNCEEDAWTAVTGAQADQHAAVAAMERLIFAPPGFVPVWSRQSEVVQYSRLLLQSDAVFLYSYSCVPDVRRHYARPCSSSAN